MSTKHKDPRLPGPSNEELDAKQAEYERKVASGEIADFKVTREGKKAPVAHDNSRFDGSLESWGDLDFDPLGSHDPLSSAVEAHRQPGMAYKLMSDKVTNHIGTQGYRPVIDTKTGDVVKVGNMYLGTIPQTVADQRKAYYINESKEEMKGIKDAQREEVDRLKANAKGMGVESLAKGEHLTGQDGRELNAGITVERGEDLAA